MTDAVRIEVDHLTDPSADPLILTDSGWLSYSITSDLNAAADTFRVRLDPCKEIVDWFRRPGHIIRIYCDGNLQSTGIVESAPMRVSREGLEPLTIMGRDFGALLVDDAAPMIEYANQTLKQLAERLIAKHSKYITEIITDNVANRFKICGKPVGAASKAAQEFTKEKRKKYLQAMARAQRGKGRSSRYYRGVETDRVTKWRNDPGQKIWEVIEWMSSLIGYRVWMSADGKLVIAQPDYWQESPYDPLFVRVDDSMQVTDSNCQMQHSADIADRHASIAVTGQGAPTATAIGRDLTDKFSAATDPAPGFWTESGGTLQERLHKTELITAQSVSDKLMVRRLARQKLEESLVKSGEIEIDVDGHRQSDQHPIWGCDTVIDVEFGPRKISAPYYIWGRTLNYDRSGRTTRLNAIPAGFWYAYDHNTFDDQSYLSDLSFRYKRYAL